MSKNEGAHAKLYKTQKVHIWKDHKNKNFMVQLNPPKF